MNDERWKVPQTETGLRTLLERIEERRTAGDEAAVGRGLLALAFLVKWVRSDNDEPPFQRAMTLADEALAIFRRLGDARGTLAALTETSAFMPPEESDARLAEAGEIAERLDDEIARADVLRARSRAMGNRDRAEATRLAKAALEIYRRHDRKTAAAACLFSLSIQDGTKEEKHAAAVESALLYREAGRPRDAARSATLAVMNGEGFMAWTDLEPLVRQGLADALAGVDMGTEGIFWGHLAKVCAAKGDLPGEQEAMERQKALKENDGLDAKARRRLDIDMTKQMIEMSRIQGDTEAVAAFEAELRRLKTRRPREGKE